MLKGRRVESPSSINIYKQCPRKYYYQYIEKLPTGSSIHLIRGSVVHQALEDFYDIELGENSANLNFLHMRLLSLFNRYWKEEQDALNKLDLTEEKLAFYKDESIMMLQNWFSRYKNKLQRRIDKGQTFKQAYEALKPKREEEYKSEEFMVRGFIDVIHEIDGKAVLIDYKTSKKFDITKEYRLQLAIYALLYEEKHGIKPSYVGIDFLKDIEKILKVDEELIKHAKFELEQIHASTTSDNKEDYPLRPSPLCKWKTGQCDFYGVCFGGLSSEEHREKYKK